MTRVYQAFNTKTKSWVKYKKYKDPITNKITTRITDVKQKEKQKPFKGINIK